jgi:hypothetical protein
MRQVLGLVEGRDDDTDAWTRPGRDWRKAASVPEQIVDLSIVTSAARRPTPVE